MSSASTPSANKACDACYKSKIKCKGRDDPPCERCRLAGLDCTFDGRRKSKMTMAEERMAAMETRMDDVQGQLGDLQNQLAELIHLQRAQFSSEGRPPGPSLPPMETTARQPGFPHAVLSPIDHASVSSNLSFGMAGLPRPLESTSYHVATSSRDFAIFNDAIAGQKRARGATLEPVASASATAADGHADKRQRGDSLPVMPPLLADSTRKSSIVEVPEAGWDPVIAGVVTEARGRELLGRFFATAHITCPIFDPEVDTWERLRQRSPLALTSLLMVAASYGERSQQDKEVEKRCREHAEGIARNSLFAAMAPAPIGTIQALVILAAWGNVSWRPGGHAFRLAMEAGLYRCIPHLVENAGRRYRSPEEVEKDKSMVVGARTWLAICKQEYELAFNHGRPLLIGDEPSVPLGRQFLEHQLSKVSDSRLVAACELLSGRQRRHLTFLGAQRSSLSQTMMDVEADNAFIDKWYRYWQDFYDRINLPSTDYLREIVTTGRCHAILTQNSRLLTGVHNSDDVLSLNEVQREALRKAIDAGSMLVHMAVNGGGYKDSFLASNSLTHVGIVFAARMVIRFATIMPEAFDLRRTAKQLEELSQMLHKISGAQLADQVREVLARARGQRVLPPVSALASPILNAQPLPLAAAVNQSGAENPFWAFDIQPEVEFQSVEELFSAGGSFGINTNAPVTVPGAANSSGFFDFFPQPDQWFSMSNNGQVAVGP